MRNESPHLRVKLLHTLPTTKLTHSSNSTWIPAAPSPNPLFSSEDRPLQMLFCNLEILQGERRGLWEGAVNGENKIRRNAPSCFCFLGIPRPCLICPKSLGPHSLPLAFQHAGPVQPLDQLPSFLCTPAWIKGTPQASGLSGAQ